MALPAKRALKIRTYLAAVADVAPVRILVPRDTAAFALRAREAATTLSIAVEGAAAETFSLKPDEVFAVDELVLATDLVLLVTTDVDSAVEIRSWRDDRLEHHDDLEAMRVLLEGIAGRLEHHQHPFSDIIDAVGG